jgi:hypothetical protein
MVHHSWFDKLAMTTRDDCSPFRKNGGCIIPSLSVTTSLTKNARNRMHQGASASLAKPFRRSLPGKTRIATAQSIFISLHRLQSRQTINQGDRICNLFEGRQMPLRGVRTKNRKALPFEYFSKFLKSVDRRSQSPIVKIKSRAKRLCLLWLNGDGCLEPAT